MNDQPGIPIIEALFHALGVKMIRLTKCPICNVSRDAKEMPYCPCDGTPPKEEQKP